MHPNDRKEVPMINNIKESSKLYASQGLSVIPVKSDKRPAIQWSQYQRAMMTQERIDQVFERSDVTAIGVVCGPVSGNLEVIDVDCKYDDTGTMGDEFLSMINENLPYVYEQLLITKTVNNGYHLYYRCSTIAGNQKLASTATNNVLIETRGEGGYVIAPPSPGYSIDQGSFTDIPLIAEAEREVILGIAKSFDCQPTQVEQINMTRQDIGSGNGSFEDFNAQGDVVNLLIKHGWSVTKETPDRVFLKRPGKDGQDQGANFHKQMRVFFVFTSSTVFQNDQGYNPSQVYTILECNGDFSIASRQLRQMGYGAQQSSPSVSRAENKAHPYIRVGVHYYKIISKVDRYGLNHTEAKPWTRQAIVDDHRTSFLRDIPTYDDFILMPDNVNYKRCHLGCYNLYNEFAHEPAEGPVKWSHILMEHVFGEQFDLGMRYIQMLYLHPDRMAPILVLISEKRQTGKTTFINWLNMIFGNNMVVIGINDLVSDFNQIYATANIIAVEETLIEKNITTEKLKALATAKYVTVNPKHVAQYKLPFFGKFILTSNNEDRFARVDEEEIRFFIRKVGIPQHINHNIEADLKNEIPAFLYELKMLPPIDFSVSRMGFTREELENDALRAVKKESRSSLYKELVMFFTDFFNEQGVEDVFATPVDIKNKWFMHNNQITGSYIAYVMKNEFKLSPEKNQRYSPFGENFQLNTKTGTPYRITRNMFITDSVDDSGGIVKTNDLSKPKETLF